MEFLSLKLINESNKPDEIKIVLNAIRTLVGQILESPNDSQLRRLKLDSELVMSNLLPYSGGLEILFEIGFVEENDSIILPKAAKLEVLEALRLKLDGELLTKCKQDKDKSKCASTLPFESSKLSAAASNSNREVNKKIHSALSPINTKRFNHNKFALRLQNSFDHVLIYESAELRNKALSKIPVDRLQNDAQIKFKAYKSNMSNEESKPYALRDFFLLEIQAWFKNEFFSWVNEPDCENCLTKDHMKYSHSSPPSSHEIIWLANNVEVYRCSMCTKLTRFPRYNHPEKLLETRKGRCGEWANCYCLCLRSLNFDARYILDWTDHVWCEVFSDSQNRWLHSDPCENVLDKPLIYEHGWKKSLSYIFAFSYYECLDVTWRYSSKHDEVRSRRTECDEQWLAKFTSDLSRKRQYSLSRERKEQIQLRLVAELVEFLTPKQIKEGEDVGRQSGSLQWRISRGETNATVNKKPSFTFFINESVYASAMKNMRVATVKYNPAKDTYHLTNIKLSDNNTEVKGWNELTSNYEHVQQKIEHDWQMCYLARTCGSSRASIQWTFDFHVVARLIDEIEVRCDTSSFESGQVSVKASLINDESDSKSRFQVSLDPANTESTLSNGFQIAYSNQKFHIRSANDENSFTNRKKLVIDVELSGGNGDNAWQHTQLFRQKLNDTNTCPFEVAIHFK